VFVLRGRTETEVFKNRVGTKMEEGTGDRKKLHNEELCDFKSTTHVIQVIKGRS
jgi:hypothetical protein